MLPHSIARAALAEAEELRSSTPTRGWRPAQRPLLWLAAGFIVVSGLLVAETMWLLHGQAMDNGQRLTASFAQVMEEQTARTLQSVDQCLQLAASGLAQLEATGSLNVTAANALMQERKKPLTFVRALWVMNAQGRIIYDSDVEAVGLELADREYFKIYLAKPLTGLHIGAPVRSRSSGKWIITASRPLHTANGTFAGIIVAAISPAWFDTLRDTAGLGAGSSTTLIRADGALMMRSPFDETLIGKTFPNLPRLDKMEAGTGSGTFEQISSIDGVYRHYAFRNLATHPDLFLIVGQPQALILAHWQRLAAPLLSLWAIASALIALMSFYLDRGAGLRIQAELSLRKSEHALRLRWPAPTFTGWS